MLLLGLARPLGLAQVLLLVVLLDHLGPGCGRRPQFVFKGRGIGSRRARREALEDGGQRAFLLAGAAWPAELPQQARDLLAELARDALVAHSIRGEEVAHGHGEPVGHEPAIEQVRSRDDVQQPLKVQLEPLGARLDDRRTSGAPEPLARELRLELGQLLQHMGAVVAVRVLERPLDLSPQHAERAEAARDHPAAARAHVLHHDVVLGERAGTHARGVVEDRGLARRDRVQQEATEAVQLLARGVLGHVAVRLTGGGRRPDRGQSVVALAAAASTAPGAASALRRPRKLPIVQHGALDHALGRGRRRGRDGSCGVRSHLVAS